METQDHKKDHIPGHDGRGVHVCSKCGWPFPNPHPNAKHRRAHKKICGTIEGYKLDGSESSTHLNIYDDEQHSDEDSKTPSPRILERSSNEKGSGAIGNRSARSEDEVFADAVTEFPDSGSGKRIEGSPVDVKKPTPTVATNADSDIRTTLSFEDATTTATISPPSNTEVQESGLSGSDDKGGATLDSDHIQLETQRDDALQPKHEKTTGEVVAEMDADVNEENQSRTNNTGDDFLETDKKWNEKTSLDGQLLDVEASPGYTVGEASEAASELVKLEDKTSDSLPDAGVIQVKEQYNNKLEPDISLCGRSPEVDEPVKASDHTSQMKVGAVQESDISLSGCSLEIDEPMKASDHISPMKVDAVQESDIPLSGRSPEVDEPMKVYAVQELVSCGSGGENSNGVERGSENFHLLSVPEGIPVTENAEAMILGFKDLKGGRLPHLVNVDSLEMSREVKEPVLKDSASMVRPEQSSEGTDVSVCNMHVLEDSLEKAGNESERIIEKSPDKTESDMPQVEVTINEVQSTEYAPVSEIDRSSTVLCREEQQSDCTHPVASPADAEVRQMTDQLVVHDACDDKKSEVDKCDAADDEKGVSIKEFNCMEGTKLASDEGKVESSCAAETETGKGDSTIGSLEGNDLAGRTVSESAQDLHENSVGSEHEVNASETSLLELEHVHLAKASDSREGARDLESKSNGEERIEGITGVNAAFESDNIEGNSELLKSSDKVEAVVLLEKPLDNIDDAGVIQESSEEHVINELQVSHPDTSSSVQNCATVTDNSARHFVGVPSDNQFESFPDEGEYKSVSQQPGTSATDLSVDSGSQSDSLEGHWGSISVLSTLSDMPAIADAEPVGSEGSKPSAETEKTNKKQKASLVRQQSEKSDIFEPPSFMTLVEPRGGDKVAGSEIQTAQHMQQQKGASPQAGWFPSLSHVMNESEGRKKNEEIIAKVTNWSTGKQHTPLKNLLGEANAENKFKLANAKDNSVPVARKDDTSTSRKDSGSSPTMANSDPGTQMPVTKAAAREWNSPARYPADIKREKRKVKGRPYWAQFVCCYPVS